MGGVCRQIMSRVITLTTDFGESDGNVGVMKGVICGINPQATVVDLSHEVEPQNIAQAAYIIWRAYRYFPTQTIHVVVVDPGVGSERRALVLSAHEAFFVAPDNGILTHIIRDAQKGNKSHRLVNLTRRRYWLPEISDVFHGRDIFAPVAAHLSLGVPFSDMGENIRDPIQLPLPESRREGETIVGQVVHIDHFGNLLSNIEKETLLGSRDTEVRILGQRIPRLSRTYAEGEAGELVAYIDSAGELAVAVVNGSAAQRLGAKPGDEIRVEMRKG
jgi:S-adenosylmethionine hydrolase